jgi:periplasmic divalent cation tolerance protein
MTTTNSQAESKKLCKSILNDKIAACITIIPNATSLYFWEGKLVEENELLLVIKTKKNLVPTLIEKIKSIHSYKTPEIISLPIEKGNKDYFDWIDKTVKLQN